MKFKILLICTLLLVSCRRDTTKYEATLGEEVNMTPPKVLSGTKVKTVQLQMATCVQNSKGQWLMAGLVKGTIVTCRGHESKFGTMVFPDGNYHKLVYQLEIPPSGELDKWEWNGELSVAGKWLSASTQGSVQFTFGATCTDNWPATYATVRDSIKSTAWAWNDFSFGTFDKGSSSPVVGDCAPGKNMKFVFGRDANSAQDTVFGDVEVIVLNFGFGVKQNEN